MFCPKCGSILVPKKNGENAIMGCSCGYKSSNSGRMNETVKTKHHKVEVVHDKEKYETLPKMKAECPKCHNDEAHFWELQTRAADEPATKFLKCTKCKHIWRDYN